MYTRNELAEVFSSLPAVPLFGLVDLVLELFSEQDAAKLQSFRAVLAVDHYDPSALAPSDLMECLKPLIHGDFPDNPIEWHIQRSFHEATLDLTDRYDAREAIEKHRAALATVIDREPASFLYAGLSLRRPEPLSTAHLRAWVGRDLEVAACLGRSAESLSAMEPELLLELASFVLARLAAEGSPHPHEAHTLVLPATSSTLVAAVRWLDELLRGRPGLIPKIGTPLPIRVVAEVDQEPDQPHRRAQQRPFFHLTHLSFPKGSDEFAELAIAIARSQPHLAHLCARYLWNDYQAPSPLKVRALAAENVSYFQVVVDRKWLEPLKDAAELVSAAASLRGDLYLEALLAIGAPARRELGTWVDTILASIGELPAGQRSPDADGLVYIVEKATCLGLPFWMKRLERPGAFRHLVRSRRIQKVLALRPDPVYRILRRAVAHPDERMVGLDVLYSLHFQLAFPLGPVAPEALELLRLPAPSVPSHIRLYLIASVGSDEAIDLLAEEPESGWPLYSAAAYFPEVWAALESRGRLSGKGVLEFVRSESPFLGSAGWRAAMMALVKRAEQRRVAEEAPNVEEEELLIQFLKNHAKALLPEQLEAAEASLGDRLTAKDRRQIHAQIRVHEDDSPPPLPWEGLSPGDMGYLLPEISAWLTARVLERRWLKVRFDKVLGPALRARMGEALGEHGEALIAELGDRWPTRRALEEAAKKLSISLDPKLLDRCADEALPPIFRAALTLLPHYIDATRDIQYSDEHRILRWVFEDIWNKAPELLARHMASVFLVTPDGTWRRGLALALVALREPVGTTVPDSLTKAMHGASTPEDREFYQRQRDTFARAHMDIQQAIPDEVRTREALKRLQIYARRARGVS